MVDRFTRSWVWTLGVLGRSWLSQNADARASQARSIIHDRLVSALPRSVLNIRVLDFEFVSYFVLRISDFEAPLLRPTYNPTV